MLEHIISVGFDDIGELFTVRDDGITFEDTPLLTHLKNSRHFCCIFIARYSGVRLQLRMM
jgi:hypothetical protein